MFEDTTHITPPSTPPTIETGETLVILQRNGEVHRNIDDSTTYGRLTEAGEAAVQDVSMQLIESIYLSDQSDSIDTIVLASDPLLGVNGEPKTEAKRALYTANKILETLKKYCESSSIDAAQILNNTATPDGSVVQISEIKGFKKVQDWPETFEYFANKANEVSEAAEALYFYDAFMDERDSLGVEQPAALGKRLRQFITFSRGAINYHTHNKDRRLVMWSVTHFDVITPLLQEILAHPSNCSQLVTIDHLGCIFLKISNDGTVTVYVNEKSYPTLLKYTYVTG